MYSIYLSISVSKSNEEKLNFSVYKDQCLMQAHLKPLFKILRYTMQIVYTLYELKKMINIFVEYKPFKDK